MIKKIITISIAILILTSAFLVFNQNTSLAATNGPSKLSIYVGPTSVLADGSTYKCIFLQLQDSNGQPARALQDTAISLTSQITYIGTVDSSVTIPKGATFVSANFYSTLAPGSTIITASATDYATVQATIITVTPVPSSIAIYGFPSTLPADGGTYPAIMVQLQDSGGSPQRAPPNGVNVTLSCSENGVGTVTNVTIPYGQTYAIANFTTTTTPSIRPAIISTLANGYASKQLSITTKSVTTDPTNPKYLKIFVGPNHILADNNSYPQIAVELQDSQGNIANSTSNVSITLISTDTNIGQINSTLTIGSPTTYAVATFNSTYKAGLTNIVAAATDWNPDTQPISTVEFIPPKLAVYAVPPVLPSDNKTYSAIIVQLQDSQGRPAKNPEVNVNVNLFSQNPGVASISSTLVIPSGDTQATGNLTVTNSAGIIAITAQSSGYSTGQGQITTYLIDYSPLQIAVTANPTSINNGLSTEITAYVTANGGPVAGAIVAFTSNNGGSFTATTDQGNGYYNTSFTAASFTTTTSCTITVSGSKTGYLDAQGTTQVTVNPAPAPTPTPTATPTPTPTPTPVNLGTITLLIEDSQGNPLNNTLVTSTTQPTGMAALTDITNETGYVTFQNATAGSYVFKIIRDGYAQLNETVTYDGGQPLALHVPLVGSDVSSKTSNNNDLVIISVVIAAVIIAIVSSILLIKRKTSPNVQKLKELKKQMNYKKEP
jgi:hypothetical protein